MTDTSLSAPPEARPSTVEPQPDRVLRESEARLRTIVAALPDVTFLIDRDGRFLEALGRTSLFALPAEEVLGRTLHEIFDRDRADAFLAVVQRAIDSQETQRLEYELEVPEGVRVFEGRCSPLREHRGPRPAAVWVSLDVTDRHRAQEERRATEQRLRAILDSEPECVKLLAPDGRLLEMNRAGLDMVEVACIEEIASLLDFVVEEDRPAFRELHQKVLAGEKARLEFGVVGARGTRRRLQSVAVPLRAADGTVEAVLAVTRDVTRERQLELLAWRAEKLDSIGRLAGGVAHDFNNLLTVILGHAELLDRQLPDGEAQQEQVREILAAGRRAQELTARLLAFGRRQSMEPRAVDVKELLGGMDILLRRLLGEDVELDVRVAADVWPALVDPARLEQVVMNLALNARDAMPSGGKLTIEAVNESLGPDEASASPEAVPGEHVRLSVSDTGRGMTAEVLKHVFEPFFTTKGIGEGTGLGLPTVYGIVSQAGGHVTVESSPGAGTTFHVHLLRSASDAPVATAPAPAATAAGRGTVLLVEDDGQIRGLVQRCLEDAGYRVLPAASGEEALALARGVNETIDLLLSDVVMPGMGGVELEAALRRERPGLRCLLMSGYAPQRVMGRGLPDSHLAMLQKPFTMKALRARVSEALEGVRPA